MEKQTVKDKIYAFVKSVPVGKVVTYGQAAKAVGLRYGGALYVGFVLNRNPDPESIPCHRVVFNDGHVSDAYAFGGPGAQIKKLKEEGVKFALDKVKLNECQWDGK